VATFASNEYFQQQNLIRDFGPIQAIYIGRKSAVVGELGKASYSLWDKNQANGEAYSMSLAGWEEPMITVHACDHVSNGPTQVVTLHHR
jgi:hypothetical protein